MEGQKKAEDFQSCSLIWSWLDRGFELSALVPKKHLGQLIGMKTHISLLCVPSQSNWCWVFLSNSDWIVLWSWPCCFVFSSVQLSQPKTNSDLASSPLWFPPPVVYPKSFCFHIQCIVMKFSQSNFHSFFQGILLFFTVFFSEPCYFSHELAIFMMT